ncbi:MAG: Do family serine endopeptidase [Paraprevotella sp.]|nr:Do family serine endopeptidase [Paraprevotella sp.]
MRETTKKVLGTAALFIGSFCIMGCIESPCRAQSSAAPSGLVDLTAAAESSVNAVVYIKVTTNSKTETVDMQDPFSDFFGDFFGFGGGGGTQRRQVQTPKREGSGSGVIISSDGYIVTNNHVVNDADELLVKLNDNREFKGRIIGTDEQTDLALIKIEGKNFPTLPIGDSDKLKLGEWVLAVGNPFNLTSTVTAGIVSAKARSMGANSIESFIQTDAAINRGNSGGALVNARGELVGINAMIYSQTGSYTGYGFAIPTTIMNKVVSDLKEFGVVQRAQLGVKGCDVSNFIDSEKEAGRDVDLGTVNGVYIAEVLDNTTASEAGLRKGDVVTAINGKEVTKMAELQEAVSMLRPGDKVKLTYIRDKKKETASAVLRNAQGTTKVLEQLDMDQFGAAMKPVDDATKKQLNLPYGLEVVAVKKGKMADAGITKGIIILQVNDKPMRTMDDFNEIVKEANRSSDRTLWIRAMTQSGKLRSAVVELDKD